ncbi:MAG: 16S rRNA (adenine(1518)-N(6)/adenine(1519)-N(6))-dimethyltransferase RsmA [Candidatus Cloacimonetes bacterium]|nr:16S rRNA (adenine(1518)-N(6)/adenine(1519)-N(6))-dimethyltransferase RsmA [Candidatus Cloacimonadota bacterium]
MEFRHKKKWGQHFLHDPNIACKIVAQAALRPDDIAWEVGAGQGILTRELLEHADRALSFEIDAALLPGLESAFAAEIDDGRLTIVQQDVLRADWESLLPPVPVKLVANLPYQITSPFLFKLAGLAPRFTLAVLMMQREVALRLRAGPGTKDYGILGLKLRYHFDIEYLFTVEPHLFVPPPNVRSAVVRLRPRDEKPAVPDVALYYRLIEIAFSNRRKMLRRNLRTMLDGEQLRELGQSFDLSRRGESLDESEFVAMCRAIAALR